MSPLRRNEKRQWRDTQLIVCEALRSLGQISGRRAIDATLLTYCLVPLKFLRFHTQGSKCKHSLLEAYKYYNSFYFITSITIKNSFFTLISGAVNTITVVYNSNIIILNIKTKLSNTNLMFKTIKSMIYYHIFVLLFHFRTIQSHNGKERSG